MDGEVSSVSISSDTYIMISNKHLGRYDTRTCSYRGIPSYLYTVTTLPEHLSDYYECDFIFI